LLCLHRDKIETTTGTTTTDSEMDDKTRIRTRIGGQTEDQIETKMVTEDLKLEEVGEDVEAVVKNPTTSIKEKTSL